MKGMVEGAAKETDTATKNKETSSDIEPARRAMQHFLSAIRQPTRNVQSVTRLADGTYEGGVTHPTTVKEHQQGLKGNSSEHIYADQARADTFLKTVESLVDGGVPPDQALILGAYKAMQYTLDVMEAPFMAEGASAHSDARRIEQTTQREAVKSQLDSISDLFGLAKPTATQAADAGRAANDGSHSPYRTDPPTDMRWPGAVAAPAPMAKSGV